MEQRVWRELPASGYRSLGAKQLDQASYQIWDQELSCPFQELGGGSPGSGLPQPPTAPHGVPLGPARPRHPYNPAGGWDTPEVPRLPWLPVATGRSGTLLTASPSNACWALLEPSGVSGAGREGQLDRWALWVGICREGARYGQLKACDLP